MQTLDALLTRRSIRSYRSDLIPDATVRDILKAGMAAPSAVDQQPWHFVVLNDPIIQNAIKIIDPAGKGITSAPVGIVVCADMDIVKLSAFWVQDVSAASQNILLAAHDLGLGAVWTGIHPMPEREIAFRELLNLPLNIVPFSFIPMGYLEGPVPEKETFKKERIHFQGW